MSICEVAAKGRAILLQLPLDALARVVVALPRLHAAGSDLALAACALLATAGLDRIGEVSRSSGERRQQNVGKPWGCATLFVRRDPGPVVVGFS